MEAHDLRNRHGADICVRALDKFGVDYTTKGEKVVFALRESDKNPSVHLNMSKGLWVDYGDQNSGGDCFELIARLRGLDAKKDFIEIAKLAAELVGEQLDSHRGNGHSNGNGYTRPPATSSQAQKPAQKPAAKEKNRKLPVDVDAFFASYGLTRQDFLDAKCQFQETRDDVYVKYRVIWGPKQQTYKVKGMARGSATGKRVTTFVDPQLYECSSCGAKTLWKKQRDPSGKEIEKECHACGCNKLHPVMGAFWVGDLRDIKGKSLVLAGGEEKAMAARRAGFTSLALQNGEKAPPPNILSHIKALQPSEVIVAFDADEAGVKAATAAAQAFLSENIPCRVVRWSSRLKQGYDLNDHLIDHGPQDLQNFILQAVQAQHYVDTQTQRYQASILDVSPVLPLVDTSDPLSRLPKFPLDALPRWMAMMAREVSRYVYVSSPCMAAIAGIGAASAMSLGTWATTVRNTEDRIERPNLYLMSTARSGKGKSPVSNKMMAPVYRRNSNMHDAWKKIRTEGEAERERLKEEHKEALKLYKKNEMTQEEYGVIARKFEDSQMAPEPDSIATDVTPEALSEVLRDNNEWATVIDTESSLINILAGAYNDPKRAANDDIYLLSWGAEPLSIRRKGGQKITLKNPRLMIYNVPQFSKLQRLGSVPNAEDRGLLARFLYAFPSEKKIGADSELMPAPIPDIVKKHYIENMMRLYVPDKTFYNGLLQSTQEIVVPMAEECDDVILEMRKFIISNFTEPTHPYYHMGTYAGKMDSNICRLALVLHLVRQAEHEDGAAMVKPISASTMRDAFDLVRDYFLPHAVYAHRLMGIETGSAAEVDFSCLKYIFKKTFVGDDQEPEQIQTVKIKNRMRQEDMKSAAVEAILDNLVASNYLLEIRDPNQSFKKSPRAYRLTPSGMAFCKQQSFSTS